MNTSNEAMEKIFYKRNFLTEVIARIDFVSPIKSVGDELPKKISKIALKTFPILEPKKTDIEQFTISKKEIAREKVEQYTEWHFHGKNREKSLVISPGSIFVVSTSYAKFEAFRRDFMENVLAFCDYFKDAQGKRLGLRYINNIELDEANPLDWTNYLHPNMLSLFEFYPDDKKSLSRIFHNVEFNYEDYNLRYQFGMHNPDYPAKIKRKVFVLDFDAYSQGLLESKDLSDKLDVFHKQTQLLFELSIKDDLRNKMNA